MAACPHEALVVTIVMTRFSGPATERRPRQVSSRESRSHPFVSASVGRAASAGFPLAPVLPPHPHTAASSSVPDPHERRWQCRQSRVARTFRASGTARPEASASTWRPVESPDGARPGRTVSTECRPSGGSFISKVRSRSNNGVLRQTPLSRNTGSLRHSNSPNRNQRSGRSTRITNSVGATQSGLLSTASSGSTVSRVRSPVSCHRCTFVDSARSAIPICGCGQCPHSPWPNRLRLTCQKALRNRFARSRDRRYLSTARS